MKSFKLGSEDYGKVNVVTIVMLLSRRDFINEQKLLSPYLPPLLIQNHLVELHESIQKPQSNDDSVTDDMLIFAPQTFEEDKGLCLGNDDESNKTDEILYKKQN